MIEFGGPIWYNYTKDIFVIDNDDKKEMISYIPNYNEDINSSNIHYLLSNDWCIAHIANDTIIIEGYTPNLTESNIQSIAQKILFNLKIPLENEIKKIRFCYTDVKLNKQKKYSFKNVKGYNIDYKPPLLRVHGYYNVNKDEFSYSKLSTEKQDLDRLYKDLFFDIEEVNKHKLFKEGCIEFDLNSSLNDEVYTMFLEGYKNYINEENYFDIYQKVTDHLEKFNFNSLPLNQIIDNINLYYSDNGYSEDIINDITIKKIEVKEILDKGIKL